ncbi:MAG: UDP-glucose 4-epimerase GalE [Chlamydiales bacterium]|nr:UDP-glucose 4-epimerase GalE [Chlamydiales bacterium]
MTKNVLVTGGAGYIGSQVCKLLSLGGYQPITLDNLSKGKKEAVQWGPLEIGDIADIPFVTKLIQKYHPIATIHLAASTEVGESVTHPDEFYQNNTVGTLNLLKALRDGNVKVFIFSSTCATYGDVKEVPIKETAPQAPINPYGWSKLFDEQIIRDFRTAFGFRYALLRYFNVAGADLDGDLGEDHQPPSHVIPILFDSISGKTPQFNLLGEDYQTPDGTCIRDYIHIVDLANAHVVAMEHLLGKDEGIELNLGSGKGFSVKELIIHAEKITGKKVPVKKAQRRPGDAPALVADASKAYKVLGWKPKHSDLETILSSAWKWYSSINLASADRR